MKKIKDTSRGAPGSGLWRWKCPETGFVISHSNFPGIKNAVKKYLIANNFPVTSQFEEQVEQNICANATPETCEDWEPPSVIEKMSSLGQALYRAAKQWRVPVVSAEEWQRRKDVCSACNFYGGSTNLLKVACQKCGCGGLKLGLSSEHCPINRW